MYKITTTYGYVTSSDINKKINNIIINSNIILLYSYNIKNSNKIDIICRRVIDFKSLDYSLIKENVIVLNDFFRINGINELKSIIESCEKFNKILVLPLPSTYYRPYAYHKKGEEYIKYIDNLYEIYEFINKLNLNDISKKDTFREFRLNQLGL